MESLISVATKAFSVSFCLGVIFILHLAVFYGMFLSFLSGRVGVFIYASYFLLSFFIHRKIVGFLPGLT